MHDKNVLFRESLHNHPPPGLESKYFRLWNWFLPLLLGLTVGWLGMVCLEIWLEGRNTRSRPAVVDTPTVYIQDNGANNFAVFLRTNPFGITSIPSPNIKPAYTRKVQISRDLLNSMLGKTFDILGITDNEILLGQLGLQRGDIANTI